MTRPLSWDRRVDVTDEALGDPRFWATFARTHVGGGGRYFFEERFGDDGFYDELLTRRIDAGVWPFLRADLGGGRYVEVELTDDHERRHWIGGADGRALLGWDSGSHALPSLRSQELSWIVERLPEARRSMGLLLTLACFFPRADDALHEWMWSFVERLPGVREDRAQELVLELVSDHVVKGVAWRRDPDLGWVNDGRHSARNPECTFAKHVHFQAIERFFADR
jgi:hypothetical protein